MRLADLAPVKLLLPAIPLVMVALAPVVAPSAPAREGFFTCCQGVRVEQPPVIKKQQPAPRTSPPA
jgi:hypothetical protein